MIFSGGEFSRDRRREDSKQNSKQNSRQDGHPSGASSGSSDEGLFRPGDFVKKILTVGIGTIFLTEDAIKGLAKEVKLPSDILAKLLESANKTRKDFYSKFSQDLIQKVMDQVDPKSLVNEVLAENEIQVNITLKPKKSNQS